MSTETPQASDTPRVAACAFSTALAAGEALKELRLASFPESAVRRFGPADRATPELLAALGIPEEDAEQFAAIAVVRTLVIVQAGERYSEAMPILVRHGGTGPIAAVDPNQSGIAQAAVQGAADGASSPSDRPSAPN